METVEALRVVWRFEQESIGIPKLDSFYSFLRSWETVERRVDVGKC